MMGGMCTQIRCENQDSATACAAWSASNTTDDECMWSAEDEMCEMVMGEDDMDGSGSGSGSGSSEETEPEESVCFSDDLRADADACNANAACMWETYGGGDDAEGDDEPMMGGMCTQIRCENQDSATACAAWSESDVSDDEC